MNFIIYFLPTIIISLSLSINAADMDPKNPLYDITNNRKNITYQLKKKQIDDTKSGKKNLAWRKAVQRRNLRKRPKEPCITIARCHIHDMIDAAMTAEPHQLESLLEYIANHTNEFESADSKNPFIYYVIEHYGNYSQAQTLVARLLAHGANLDTLSPETGLGALHVATYYQYDELIEQLVAAQAKVNRATIDGQTPLHIACMTGNLKIVEYLVSNGADVHARDHFDATPMHFVVGRSLSRAMPSFLTFPNQRVGRIVNTKYWSQIEVRKNILDFLLNHNAELEPRDDDNNTPYSIACREVHLSLASYIEQKKAL